jgi:hypothetical protein
VFSAEDAQSESLLYLTQLLSSPDARLLAIFRGRSGRWWGVAKAELLTHGVGPECVPPEPGSSDIEPEKIGMSRKALGVV